MIPELFRIGQLSISPFGVTMVAAFLAGYVQVRWGFRRLGIGDDEDASAILLAAGLGGILGAKLYYAALYQDWRLLFDRSGLVWFGGFLLGTLAVVWTIRRRRLPAWQAADAIAPGVALGYAIGRIGCFLVGDDYGMPTGLPWGVAFPHGLPGPTTADFMRRTYGAAVPGELPGDQLIPVHPTQLYETLACLGIWYVGLVLLRRRARPGTTTLAVLALMAFERFLVEFVRAKDDRFFDPLTLAQVISLMVLVALVALGVRRAAARRRGSPAGG